jgi:hypothetical protein
MIKEIAAVAHPKESIYQGNSQLKRIKVHVQAN